MSESLLAFLKDIDADADTIEQATRYYLAERTDDLPYQEMRAQVFAAAADTRQAQELLQLLAVRSDYLEQGALAVLSVAWDEPGQSELIRRALLDAKAKLPVIEASILGIVVMYGMYLLATRGKKRVKRVIVRTEQGRFKEITETEYFSATGPLSTITQLFKQPSD